MRTAYQYRAPGWRRPIRFPRQVKHSGAPAGDKHTDGKALHLLVTASCKYRRLSYRFDAKQKTLAQGVYLAVSLAAGWEGWEAARKLQANEVGPTHNKRNDKQA